jgi:hypothetical protein
VKLINAQIPFKTAGMIRHLQYACLNFHESIQSVRTVRVARCGVVWIRMDCFKMLPTESKAGIQSVLVMKLIDLEVIVNSVDLKINKNHTRSAGNPLHGDCHVVLHSVKHLC